MHPVVISDQVNEPWTPVTISLALSAVMMIAVLMLGGEAFIPHR